MPFDVDQLNAASALWADRLWAVVWQSVVLTALVAGIALMLRRSSPAVRYWLWQIVAIKLLLMPFWIVAVPLPWLEPAPAEKHVAAPDADAPAGGGFDPLLRPVDSDLMRGSERDPALPAAAAPDPAADTKAFTWRQMTWQSSLMLAWTAVVLWQIARIARQRVGLVRLLRQAAPADERLLAEVREAAAQLRLRKVPSVALTEAACSPFVCGLRRPTLVLPRALTASLEPAELRHVLLHELAHVKRRDLIWGWIPEIARIVYFFHPLVYWIGYRIRLERELACDQLAMAHTGHDAAAYANTLVRVVSRTSEPAALRAAAGATGLDGESSPASQSSRPSRPKSRQNEESDR